MMKSSFWRNTGAGTFWVFITSYRDLNTSFKQLIADSLRAINNGMTLYLKYRPQKISDLHLAEVRQGLTKILASKNLPHAWLFSGPRGTGKTSTARILAKVVNCTGHKGQDFEPCNKCRMCQAITSGSAVDVVEIDAASNRGIDEIRELREKIKLAPMQALYKVYIIDEVHMLTAEAANALLKTLEEPPANTLFILCTTEADRLPETVVSRCTRVIFKRPTPAEAVASLRCVLEGEKVKGEDKVLGLIAAVARGSFRDGTKILEQVILGSGEVTDESVRQVTGVLSVADPDKFVKNMASGLRKECLEIIQELYHQGVNLRRFVEMISESLREELMKTVAGSASGFKSTDEIIKLISGLDRAYEQMKFAAVVQLPLEVWVIENTPNGNENKNTEVREEEKIIIEPAAIKENKGSGKGKFNLEEINGKWLEIMKMVRPKNHSVEALLRSTKPVDFDGEKLELEVFYKFHKDKLESEKCRQIVEETVGEMFDTGPVKLYLRLGQGGRKAAEEVTAAGVGEDIVKAAQEIFKAEAV
jgi:DNA polymerase-3 subunit gamma/tau